MKKINYEKDKLYLLILIFAIFIPLSSYSQSNNIKPDTIYYLVNLESIPVNDRMISIEPYVAEPYGGHVFYTIHCPCLQNNVKPVFRGQILNERKLDRTEAASIKFIKLPDLIEYVKKNDTDPEMFNKQFPVVFIIRKKGELYKNRVFYLGSVKSGTSD